MLRAIKKYAQEQNIPAYISLEERNGMWCIRPVLAA